MVNLWAYDVEILPNFFSITFVNIASYLKQFKDCCKTEIKKGKEKKTPIPLTEKYTVKEIIEKLDKVEKKQFYITNNNDSQLLQLAGFINSMNQGQFTQLYGYNNLNYDKLMVACFLMYLGIYGSTQEIITTLFETSQKIISLQDDRNASRNDYLLNSLRDYKLPFQDVDLFQIFALNKAGSMTDANGNKIYFGKSLKQTSINVKWYELLEYELPPIDEEEANIYLKEPRYKGYTLQQLNVAISKWSRHILDKYIPSMMHYNLNDVFIVCEIARLYSEEIRLRYTISNAYEVNVLNSSRSDMADKLFVKFYSEFSNLKPFQWRGKKTERTKMAFKKVIFDKIKFKTPELQAFLEEIREVVLTRVSKTEFERKVTIGNTIYTVATGGLHSEDKPRVLKSKITGDNIKDYYYVHWDISSFYPSLIVAYRIAPEHLDEGVFVKLIDYFRTTRIKAKHSEEDLVDGIPKEVVAEALKIVINSIYGKFSYEWGDIYDRMCTLKTTINGQLFILMLCEELELNGIPVISANTDGIVVKLKVDKEEKFNEIAESWCKYTGLEADAEQFKCYINRDINNYIAQETNGKIDYKGDLNPNMYKENLQKGYNAPIVAKAVVEYFINDKPVIETLYECKDILDFCKTQNIGKKFAAVYTDSKGEHIIQRNVRFYVSNKGGQLFKKTIDKNLNNLCAGQKVTILNTLDDMPITLRDINYKYYYDEAMKIISPIELGISPNEKGNALHKTKSGKALLKKYAGVNPIGLFDSIEDG